MHRVFFVSESVPDDVKSDMMGTPSGTKETRKKSTKITQMQLF
jgi:hypothetical protein